MNAIFKLLIKLNLNIVFRLFIFYSISSPFYTYDLNYYIMFKYKFNTDASDNYYNKILILNNLMEFEVKKKTKYRSSSNKLLF